MNSSSKKVALFVPSLRGGGAERAMATLASEFAKRDLHVDLLLAQREGPYVEELHQGVTVLDFRASRVAECIPKLADYLRAEKPQALVSAMIHANIAAILAKLLVGSGSRIIVSEQNSLTRIQGGSLRHKLMISGAGLAYRFANAVVAVSQGVADDLAATKLPQSKIHVVYNPVVSQDLLLKAKAACSHPWLQAGQAPVILAVGRLETQKQYATLIQAFQLVRQRRSARLIILGEGTLRTDLENLIAKLGLGADVDLPGFVSNPYSYMSRAAVFALTSAWEGLPTVLIEALACGAPIVSTDCPSGPSEILENGKWGLLVRCGDVQAIAKAIDNKLNEPASKRGEYENRALDFSSSSAAERYLALIERTN
jgi:glycosyltransferase involved in cell wall biosynthesis